MPDDPNAPAAKPLVVVFGVLAAAALLAWMIVGFVGCRHAGLV